MLPLYQTASIYWEPPVCHLLEAGGTSASEMWAGPNSFPWDYRNEWDTASLTLENLHSGMVGMEVGSLKVSWLDSHSSFRLIVAFGSGLHPLQRKVSWMSGELYLSLGIKTYTRIYTHKVSLTRLSKHKLKIPLQHRHSTVDKENPQEMPALHKELWVTKKSWQ